MTPLEKIIKITNAHFETDVMQNTKKRWIVDGRAVCYKILHDDGFSLIMIGRMFGKSHATIINALKNFEHTIMSDTDLKMRYVKCRRDYRKDPDPVFLMDENELRSCLINTRKEYEDLLFNFKKLYLSNQKMEAYEPLFKIIRERVPKKRIGEFKTKLNTIANGIHN